MVIMDRNKTNILKVMDKDDDNSYEKNAEEKQNYSKELLIIAQEIKIVRSLASNDVNKRNRQMRKLKKWLQLRSRSSFPFTVDDFLRIWKGLYYNMWMSDKPLVQEELAEQLSQLVDCFNGDIQCSVNFFGAFIRTMCQEWFGIDQWRIDKFLMLVRRMLRSMFNVLKGTGWVEESVEIFNEYMQDTVLAENNAAIGLTMHYLDIFFEELAKVADGSISPKQVGAFVRPFVYFIGMQRDPKLISHCRNRVFCHLLYQSSLGREYSEKYNAWKEMGFPTASIHDLERDDTESQVGDEEKEEDALKVSEVNGMQKIFDPRAGNVDVFVPELPLDGKYIIEGLQELLYKEELNMKRRKLLRSLLEIFKTYQKGEFPLGVKRMPRFEAKSEVPLMQQKLQQLENLENELYGTSRKLKQLNKRKRRKLLKSLNFDNADESNFEEVIEKSIPKDILEREKKARGEMMNGWVEEEIEDIPINAKKVRKTKKEKTKTPTIKINGQKKKKLKQTTEEDEPAKKVRKLDTIALREKAREMALQSKQMSETAKKSNKLGATPTMNGEATATKVEKTNKQQETKTKKGEWDKPLDDGEVEYFIPSRKLLLRRANSNLVRNPLAKKQAMTPTSVTGNSAKEGVMGLRTPKTPGSGKRVKIALKHNTVQNPSEYIQQIKSSPNVPYDAAKKPGKGLLKPNLMPSPINPFYKKKIGLRLINDTI